MTTNIYVPPPFNQNTQDIINVFQDFANSFESILDGLLQNVRNTSNGMEPLLNIVIAPLTMVENLAEPFNEISTILGTYSTAWSNPNGFLGDILDVYLFIQYTLKTLMIITPEVFIRIVESSVDLSYATIHRGLDHRILSLPYRSLVSFTDTMIGGVNLKAFQFANSAVLNMQITKEGYRNNLFVFKDSQINKFYIVATLFTLVTFSAGLYFRERWRKLPFKIGT